MTIRKLLYYLFFLAFVITSCNKSKVYEKHIKLDNNTWERNHALSFEVNIKEEKPHDIYIAVRHASYYPFANVVVGLTIETPHNEQRFMRHDLLIRHQDGSFKGDGLGDIWDINIKVFERFPINGTGTHTFTIENLMHLVEIKGIMAIGLIVKQSD